MTVLETARLVSQWPVADQRELIHLIDAQLDDDHETFEPPEMTPELLAELKRRLDEYRANPEIAIPWEVVEARLGRKTT